MWPSSTDPCYTKIRIQPHLTESQSATIQGFFTLAASLNHCLGWGGRFTNPTAWGQVNQSSVLRSQHCFEAPRVTPCVVNAESHCRGGPHICTLTSSPQGYWGGHSPFPKPDFPNLALTPPPSLCSKGSPIYQQNWGLALSQAYLKVSHMLTHFDLSSVLLLTQILPIFWGTSEIDLLYLSPSVWWSSAQYVFYGFHMAWTIFYFGFTLSYLLSPFQATPLGWRLQGQIGVACILVYPGSWLGTRTSGPQLCPLPCSFPRQRASPGQLQSMENSDWAWELF